MSSKADGARYAPKGEARAVVGKGEFPFAAMRLDHGHINGMCNGLTEAGAELCAVYDPDPEKVKQFLHDFPGTPVAASEAAILEDPAVKLVAAAAVPSERGPLGCRVMDHGKDYFTDKTPFTEMSHLTAAKEKDAETGRKYMVYYAERLHVECALHAGDLINDGAIGRVVQVIGLGPHRLRKETRPAWFFEKAKYGGILCDIGSHQFEQFLSFTGAKDADVVHAKVGNYNNPDTPELEDFGDASLVADNGATGYFRVDWFTPDGLSAWGDGRTMILGTEGTIELRKYVNVATAETGDHLFLVNGDGEQHLELAGKIGFPFFGQMILDCLGGTENAMTQEHAFKAGELCIRAQEIADRAGPIKVRV